MAYDPKCPVCNGDGYDPETRPCWKCYPPKPPTQEKPSYGKLAIG